MFLLFKHVTGTRDCMLKEAATMSSLFLGVFPSLALFILLLYNSVKLSVMRFSPNGCLHWILYFLHVVNCVFW